MSFYFHISTGLRGCYMPDNAYALRVDTRRELRTAIAAEAERYADSGYRGASQRAISSLAARAWSSRGKATLDHCLPVAPPHAPSNYCEGIFVSSATRKDYLDYQVTEN